MKDRVYLIDLDHTVVHNGTQDLLPGALEALQALAKKGRIYYFSCWAFTPRDLDFLRSLPDVPMAGYIRKPFAADDYVFIDDKLNMDESDTSLPMFPNNDWF